MFEEEGEGGQGRGVGVGVGGFRVVGTYSPTMTVYLN